MIEQVSNNSKKRFIIILIDVAIVRQTKKKLMRSLAQNNRIVALRSHAVHTSQNIHRTLKCSFKVSTEQKHNGQFICKSGVVGARAQNIERSHSIGCVRFVFVFVFVDNIEPYIKN